MSKYRMRAAALLAAGAVAGEATAVSLSASAEETGSSSAAPAQAGAGLDGGPGGHGGPGGPGGHGRGGFGADAAELAEELGVGEDELESALDAVREDLRPNAADRPTEGEEHTPPSEAERAEREAAFAKALADELGIAESTVTEALDELQAAHRSEHRTELSERLDQAVKDGDLTAADKASVLKAYDAGVLGGR